ncbi:MAG: D-alanine glycine permease, partial [uncultured bacterium]
MLASTAGMGAESIILGTARTQDPVTQGLVAMLVPFVDIFIFGLITALVIITTGAYDTSVLHPNLVGQALSLGLGSNIGLHLANSTNIFFAFCAIVCWSYYGDRAVSYLFGKQGVFTFRYVYLFFIIFGAVMIVESTLTMCHVFYGLMALPYLVSVFALSPVVVRLTKQHFRKIGSGN